MNKINSTLWQSCNLESTPLISLQKSTRILSKEENYRANKFRFETHKNRYIRSRIYLRLLLSELIGKAPDQLIITENQNKKPQLKDNLIYFNLSKSDNYAVFAFNHHEPVGIDLEYNKSDLDFIGLSKTVFTDNEITLLERKSAKQQQAIFYKLWTAKEAYLKLIGTGLLIEPQRVKLNFSSETPISSSIENYPFASLNYLKVLYPNLTCCLATKK